MNIVTLMLHMKRWATNPPSERMVIFVFCVIFACLALFAVDYFIGLPEWMQADRLRTPHVTTQ